VKKFQPLEDINPRPAFLIANLENISFISFSQPIIHFLSEKLRLNLKNLFLFQAQLSPLITQTLNSTFNFLHWELQIK